LQVQSIGQMDLRVTSLPLQARLWSSSMASCGYRKPLHAGRGTWKKSVSIQKPGACSPLAILVLGRGLKALAQGGASRRATAELTQQKKMKTAPAWDPKDMKYTYPLTDGMQAFNVQPSSKTDSMDLVRICVFLLLHVIAVAYGPSTFSWEALSLCLVLSVVLQTLGNSLSYHRQLSHRSFECPKPLEYFFAWCGVLNMQGNPVWWAMKHSWHHKFSDTAWDPHTPREGLWTAHAGWYFEEERTKAKMPKAIAAARTNIREDPSDKEAWNLVPWFYKESPEFYDWLRQTYYLHQIGQVAVLYLLGGWSYVVWGFVIRYLLVVHGWATINSLSHVWGEQPFRSRDDSKNNLLVALLASGEGWHNNHHAFPRSAKHGLLANQFDPTYAVIATLEKLGLAWNVQLPSSSQLAAKRKQDEK